MIYASDITNYRLSAAKREECLLFWMVVAGKEANMQAAKLDQMLANMVWSMRCGVPRFSTPGESYKADVDPSPFTLLAWCIERELLRDHLVAVRMGKYNLLVEGMRAVVKLDAVTCTLEELEAVPGIGPKTARCFLMHSRPNQRLAGLDTHILKFLGAAGHKVPKSTPPAGPKYRELEEKFLAIADEKGLAPADLDLRVWRFFAGRDADLDLSPRKVA